jgi:hypothetical protein
MIISIGNSPFNTQKVDIFMHPIRYDLDVKKYFTYEPSSEEAILALITKQITYPNLPNDLKTFFDSLDEGYLFSESNFDEWELEEIISLLEEKNILYIGSDLLKHPSYHNILKLSFILKKYGNFEVNHFIEDENLSELEDIDTFDGSVIYFDNTKKCDELIVSNQFLLANRKHNNDIININNELKKIITVDDKLKGVFGIVCEESEGYPFRRVKLL